MELPVVNQIECQYCNKLILIDSKFCNYCGLKQGHSFYNKDSIDESLLKDFILIESVKIPNHLESQSQRYTLDFIDLKTYYHYNNDSNNHNNIIISKCEYNNCNSDSSYKCNHCKIWFCDIHSILNQKNTQFYCEECYHKTKIIKQKPIINLDFINQCCTKDCQYCCIIIGIVCIIFVVIVIPTKLYQV